jgi:acetyl esterase/lipase
VSFVLPVPRVEPRRHGPLDIYATPGGGPPRPAVLLVHGGPVTPDADPQPREWPGFVAYASLLAARGVVGVTFNHRLYDADHAPLAADDLTLALAAARAEDGVDPDRIALWAFSMGGVLPAAWLAAPPPWLRALAWNYPILRPGPDWRGDVPRFDCVAAVGRSPRLPTMLLRVEHEIEGAVFGPAQDAFVAAARARGADLHVIDVPGAHHPFEERDHTEATRAAVREALDWVTRAVTG